MTENTIKSGQEVIKEFLNHAGEDSGVDKGSIEAIKTLLASEGKLSVSKLLKELERRRKG